VSDRPARLMTVYAGGAWRIELPEYVPVP
jgi:hypothetical protein